MELIETPIFERRRHRFFTAEEYRELQNELIVNPTAGAVVPKSGGFRKLRRAMRGKGKRGGARIIYYRQSSERIYLVFVYQKTDREDLSADQLKQLSALVE